mgnify:CR=1 FL=1
MVVSGNLDANSGGAASSGLRVGITGASGLIGSALSIALRSAGHVPVPFVRRTAASGEIGWDPAGGRLAVGDLADLDAVVNLAGAGIGDHRWTDEYKRTLRDSRIRSTDLLASAISEARTRGSGPSVLLSGSAIGAYGPHGDEQLDEAAPLATDFLGTLCRDWEAATAPAEAAGVRVAHLRTGIVLSPDGGALKKQLPLFKLGLGGRFGSGRAWQSWIAIDDHVAAMLHLLGSDVSGPVNLTAPNPVTGSEFARVLGAVLHRPAILPIPRFGPALLLGGELVDALLFTGQRVLPSVLLADEFAFAHPQLDGALRALLRR